MGEQASLLIQPLIRAAAAGQRLDDMARGQYWIHPALSEVAGERPAQASAGSRLRQARSAKEGAVGGKRGSRAWPGAAWLGRRPLGAGGGGARRRDDPAGGDGCQRGAADDRP